MKLYQLSYLVFLSLTAHLVADEDQSWACRTLEAMSLDEKIGQLFMIAAYVDPEFASLEIGNSHIIEEIDLFIRNYHVGGLAYVGPSECVKQVELTNHYQEISRYPLLIAQDLEWGLSMRLKDGVRFPKNMTLGSIKDNRLIYEMGKEIGRQAQLIGVHMNLSPVLDVNTESENIAINVRSFGSDPQEVALKGVAMIRGLQDAGIIASAKHFPGLGGIVVDPHLGLPHCYQNKTGLQEIALSPFVQAIAAGVLSIQNEHVIVPALEPDLNTPASLSHEIVTNVLKKELGFQGLVLSGALRMKALTEHFSAEEIILKAFLAGNDMLLMPQDFIQAYRCLKKTVEEGAIKESELDARVLKILQLKQRVKLDRQRLVEIPSLEQIHSSSKELKKCLFQNAVTLVCNEQSLIPLSLPQKHSVCYMQLGNASSHYFNLLNQQLTLDLIPKITQKLNHVQLDQCSLIILAVYPEDSRRIEQIRLLTDQGKREALKNFRVHGLSESFIQLVAALEPYEKKTIVTFFGNPFGLTFFNRYSTVIMAHEVEADAEAAAVDFLLGTRIN